MSFTLQIPMRLPSAANLREHWAAKHRRVKQERVTVGWLLRARPRPTLPVTVTLTRIAPRAFDDDNLRGAFKGIRDEVARWLGVDDADPRVTWAYEQRRSGVREYHVLITVEGRA